MVLRALYRIFLPHAVGFGWIPVPWTRLALPHCLPLPRLPTYCDAVLPRLPRFGCNRSGFLYGSFSPHTIRFTTGLRLVHTALRTHMPLVVVTPALRRCALRHVAPDYHHTPTLPAWFGSTVGYRLPDVTTYAAAPAVYFALPYSTCHAPALPLPRLVGLRCLTTLPPHGCYLPCPRTRRFVDPCLRCRFPTHIRALPSHYAAPFALFFTRREHGLAREGLQTRHFPHFCTTVHARAPLDCSACHTTPLHGCSVTRIPTRLPLRSPLHAGYFTYATRAPAWVLWLPYRYPLVATFLPPGWITATGCITLRAKHTLPVPLPRLRAGFCAVRPIDYLPGLITPPHPHLTTAAPYYGIPLRSLPTFTARLVILDPILPQRPAPQRGTCALFC